MESFIYILASKKNGTLYIGVTADLIKRIYEHRNKIRTEFTKKYNVMRLVYYEIYDDITKYIAREKRLKGWKRALIEKENPHWNDLYECLH